MVPKGSALEHGLTEITDFFVLKMALLSFTGIGLTLHVLSIFRMKNGIF